MNNSLNANVILDPELEALKGQCSSLEERIATLMKELFLELEKKDSDKELHKKIKKITEEAIKAERG